MEFIEFIGNPGSGKSTIADNLTIELRKKYMIYNRGMSINRLKKTLYLILLLILKPLLFSRLVKNVRKTEQPNINTLLKMCLNILYITGLVLYHKKTNNNFIFLDQGLLQAIWSIEIESKNNFDIKPLEMFLHKNYKLVYVTVDDKILIKRLNNRDSNDSRFEQNRDSMDLNKSNQLLDKIYNQFNGPKIKYDNDKEINLSNIIEYFKVKEIL